MIRVNGNLFVKVDFGVHTDAVGQDYAFEAFITEFTGNRLPVLEMSLHVVEEWIDYLVNTATPITLTYGQTQDDAVSTNWRIVKYKPKGTEVKLYCVLDSLDFRTKYVTEAITGSSTTCISTVAKRYFTMADDTKGFSDSMTWVNPNTRNDKFLNDVWIHSYKQGGLLGTAITSDGKYVMTDMFDFSAAKTCDQSDKSDVPMYHILGFVGNQSTWMGISDPSQSSTKSDSGTYIHDKDSLGPKISHTYDRTSFGEYNKEHTLLTDNVHDNFHKAKNWNLANLSAMSTNTLLITVQDYSKIQMLDKLKVTAKTDSLTQISDLKSGNYVVTQKIMEINNVFLKQYAILSRDSINMIKDKEVFGGFV